MTRVLVLNAGSSTLKASVLDISAGGPLEPVEPVGDTTVSWGSDATRVAGRADAVERVLASFDAAGVRRGSIEVVGHRVVHGGERFVESVIVDDAVLDELDGLGPLAPLHNPVAVETIRAARSLLGEVRHVAAFDTAFHATLPEAWVRYPVPDAWRREHGVRRYGFHGLSVEWSTARAAALLGRPLEDLELVVAHLGSGCSVTAVSGGRSVSNSMGLTPLEGPMMGTRAGSIDPGILVHLLRRGVGVEELAEALDHEAGLLGVSGVSGDVREIRAAASTGSAEAALALEMFAVRAAAWIGFVATSLPRLDALVFTAGIGEHDGDMRQAICARLPTLGIDIVAAEAVAAPSDADIVMAETSSRVRVLRIASREDVVIAHAAAKLVVFVAPP